MTAQTLPFERDPDQHETTVHRVRPPGLIRWTWRCRTEGCTAAGGVYGSRWDALAAGVLHERGDISAWAPIGGGHRDH